MRKRIPGLMVALALAGCSDDGPFSDGEREARFTLTWAITVAGSAGTCAEVGAVAVEVEGTRDETGDDFVESFDCDDLSGATELMPPGNYTLEIRLVDAGDVQLNAVDIVLTTELHDGNDEELGNYEFAF